MKKPSRNPFLLVSLFTLFCRSTANNTVDPTQTLADRETLISAGGSFALGFFSPANSTNRYVGIWYNNIKAKTVVWVANRRNPIADSTGNLTITTNGAIVITDGNSGIIWSSSAGTNTVNPVLQLLDTGNLVVREASGGGGSGFAWQSFDYPTDTLLPGMKLGWDFIRGLNRNLTAWRSNADPAPGDNFIAMDIRGGPELTVLKGSIRWWRSGNWNGNMFSGVPEMRNYRGFTFDFVDNSTEIYYSYGVTDPSIITRLVVNESGVIQRYVWLPGAGMWNVFWYMPKAPCDSFSPCGPYGICDPNGTPMCSCLEGFKPRSPAAWNLRDGSGGCVRKTELDCRNGTDGFMMVANARLPDTSVATVDRSMSLDECRDLCTRNCSCTGYANADVRGGGSGCFFWAAELVDLMVFVSGGQDLYVRLADADLASMSPSDHSRKNKTTNILVITLSLVSGALLVAWIVCHNWRKKMRRISKGVSPMNGQLQDESSIGEEELELPLFDLVTVVAMTNNFATENKLGAGGFGPVYKGSLGEGVEIAVKRLSKTSKQGIDEFKNEVTLIAKLQHRNLVRLLGACVQANERMLIYDYMHNKSLDMFLFDKPNGVNYLDWSTRCQIIAGIARGLLYLHRDSRFRIIHRDLKASNILLDKEMNPKISDFGMARIFGGEAAITKTRRVVGTYGYMSPEYAMNGIFSVKSDVFSFGVLVLEIVSGRRNKGVYLTEPNLYLLGIAWSLWSEGKSLELIDPAMGDSFSMDEVMRCMKVGLLCVQESPEDRPTMSSVVLMLSSDIASLSEPKQPGFVARNDCSETTPSPEKQDSLNGVTITASVGR